MTILPSSREFPFVLISGATFAFFVTATSASDLTPAQKLIASRGILVIAHRGNSSAAPENTLPAFQSALDVKVDLVELDYYHSADGIPVVIHDEMLDRTTNSEGIFERQKLKATRTSAGRRIDDGRGKR